MLKIPLSSALVFLLVFMVGAVNPDRAYAQDANEFRRVEIAWSPYTFARQGEVNLHGGELSFVVHASERVAIVADLSAHVATESGIDLELVTYRFGPRFVNRTGRWTTFGHVLAGGTRLTGSDVAFLGGEFVTVSQSFNGFALAVGGGVDYAIAPWFALRPIQADYSLLHFTEDLIGTSHGFRVGPSLVFRFGA